MTPRAWRIVCLASVVTMIGASAVGALLSARPGEPPPGVRVGSLVVLGLAFLTFVTSVPPVAVRAFLAAQARLGNAAQPLVAFVRRHERAVVWAVWLLWAAGAAVALPVALRDVMSAP